MTSGRRTTKVGLKRMDAALDALCPMGFSKDLVRRTINKLLKAYGGDQGWSFIEGASYKVVIDVILEEQEKAEMKDGVPKLPEHSEPKVESADIRASCSKDEASDLKEVRAGVDSQLAHSEAQIQMDILPYLTQDSSDNKVVAENCTSKICTAIESSKMSSKNATGPPLIRRRKPCYGWISSDDEEEDEDVVCTKAAK